MRQTPGGKLDIILFISLTSKDFSKFTHLTLRQSWSWAKRRAEVNRGTASPLSLPSVPKTVTKSGHLPSPTVRSPPGGGRQRRNISVYKASAKTLWVLFFLFPLTQTKSQVLVSVCIRTAAHNVVCEPAATTTTAAAAAETVSGSLLSALSAEGGAEVAAAHAPTDCYCETKII